MNITQMEFKVESEKLAVMNSAYPCALKPLSLIEDPEIQGIRKKLIIIISVLLVIFVIATIISIVEVENKDLVATGGLKGVELAFSLLVIVILGSGIYATYQYFPKGLWMFGWAAIIAAGSMGIFIIVFCVFLISTLVSANHANNQVKSLISATVVDGLIFIIIFLFAFILTTFAVKFAFKLAKLINMNHSTVVQ